MPTSSKKLKFTICPVSRLSRLSRLYRSRSSNNRFSVTGSKSPLAPLPSLCFGREKNGNDNGNGHPKLWTLFFTLHSSLFTSFMFVPKNNSWMMGTGTRKLALWNHRMERIFPAVVPVPMFTFPLAKRYGHLAPCLWGEDGRGGHSTLYTH